MKVAESKKAVEELIIQGQYETVATNTERLANELNKTSDLRKLSINFDKGYTPLRDVGNMIEAQRSAILHSHENGEVNEYYQEAQEIFTTPVDNLHQRIISGPQDQPIGHNFFVNASMFVELGFPWATEFDDLIKSRSGSTILDIAQSEDIDGKDALLEAITNNPDDELAKAIAVYLAGRSQQGEIYLMQKYGEVLNKAKEQVLAVKQEIAKTTGLSSDMIERLAGQIKRTTFGSFDHLAGLVTSDNSGAAGDYRIGSLRVEVQFDGNVQSPSLPDKVRAHKTIAHELCHSASAQDDIRCGLMATNGQGLEANEGMTEYIAQLAVGMPGIKKLANGSFRVDETVPYTLPTTTMLALHEQFKTGRNKHFAVLFNAYHGDVVSKIQLEQALDAFYSMNSDTLSRLRN